MRYLLLGGLALALAACAADGTFKSPLEMSAAERCANVMIARQLAANHGLDTSAYDADIALLCPAATE